MKLSSAYLTRHRAGASALAEYRRQRRLWRRRHRWMFGTLVASILVAFVASLVLMGIPGQSFWTWIAGMVTGGLIALYLAFRMSPPGWIDHYLEGAWGEQRTAKALVPLLRQGWVAVHDIARAGYNLDHVLVGTAGVFVLDSKNPSGTAHIDGERLSVTHPDAQGRSYVKDGFGREVVSQAVELNALVRQRCRRNVWVSAVVVLWCPFPQGVVERPRVSYVHGERLVDWLRGQQARLNGRDVDEIVATLEPRRPSPSASRRNDVPGGAPPAWARLTSRAGRAGGAVGSPRR